MDVETVLLLIDCRLIDGNPLAFDVLTGKSPGVTALA